jgi:hypothetical protein
MCRREHYVARSHHGFAAFPAITRFDLGYRIRPQVPVGGYAIDFVEGVQTLPASPRPDVVAIAAFLKNLPPTHNQMSGPFDPTEKLTVFVMKIVPPVQ